MPRRTNLFSQIAKELKKPLLVAKPTKTSHLLRNLIILAMASAAVVAAIMFMKNRKSDTPSPDTPSPDTPSPDAPSPDTPSPPAPSGFIKNLYGVYEDDSCADGDTTIISDFRNHHHAHGDNVNICGQPGTANDSIVAVKQADDVDCGDGWNTAKVGGVLGKDDLDLRKGVGHNTIRVCYKTGNPGKSGIKALVGACSKGLKSIVTGDRLNNNTGHKKGAEHTHHCPDWDVCADE